MAAIVRTWDVGTGCYVRIKTGGQHYDLNFPIVPSTADRDETILCFESRIRDEIARENLDENEESDI